MDIFQIGDRVRLRADTAGDWKDPKVNLRAKRGIPAAVTSVAGADSRWGGVYFIKFDTVGRMRAMRLPGVMSSALERLPE